MDIPLIYQRLPRGTFVLILRQTHEFARYMANIDERADTLLTINIVTACESCTIVCATNKPCEHVSLVRFMLASEDDSF